MRARIRHAALPFPAEHLGGDVALSLARTAAVARPDAEYVDGSAPRRQYARLKLPAGVHLPDIPGADAVPSDHSTEVASEPTPSYCPGRSRAETAKTPCQLGCVALALATRRGARV